MEEVKLASGVVHYYELQPGDGTRYKVAVMMMDTQGIRGVVGGIQEGEWAMVVPLNTAVGSRAGMFRLDAINMNKVGYELDTDNHWTQFLMSNLIVPMARGLYWTVEHKSRYLVDEFYPRPWEELERIDRAGVGLPILCPD